MKNILITGGTGYLGGRIADFFSRKKKYRVHVTGRRTPSAHGYYPPHLRFLPLDVMNVRQCENACKKMDVVIHLAALNEAECAAHPGRSVEVNVLGTQRMLAAAEKCGVRRFLYFSTAHVYGSPLRGVITENTVPRPVHPYSITHRAAEDFVLAARKPKGLVIRLSNGFGAPLHPFISRWNLVVNDLCRQAVTTRKITLRSSGIQKRDFVCFSDVARASEHLINLSNTACGDGLYNLGGMVSLSILSMSKTVATVCNDVLGYKPPISVPQRKPGEKSNAIIYRMDKLLKTGFVLTGDMKTEITNTLLLCKQAFNDGLIK